jgi:hypothetical protein
MPDRRYSEREFALILKHASELQEGLNTAAPHGEFTLEEIQSIAAAAGIDAQNVLEAARALPMREVDTGVLHGPASRFEFSEYLPGEIGPGGIEDIIDAARTETGEDGRVTQVLDSVEWRAHDAYGTLVVVTRRSGRARLKVIVDGSARQNSIYALGVMVGAFGFMLVGTALNLGTLPALLTFAAGGIATTYAAVRLTWRATARRLEERGRRLFEVVARAAGSAISA